jgi:hypothetical protein
VNGPRVAVVPEPAIVIAAPLAGAGWVAFNAFSAYDHRRDYVTVDGRFVLAQRFDVDWMRLGPDGRLFHGDSKSNANYYGYGANVLAVADALALLGSSGNSDAPHLHFHIVDANSPMAAEGIPYELATFHQMGVLNDSKVPDAGEAWHPKTQTEPVPFRREFPIDNAVIAFP